MKMPTIGIMQGRLVPPVNGHFQCFPRDNWKSEFAGAAAADLDSIEWIYDVYGEDVNPIAHDAGLSSIRDLCQTHGVAVRSVCADVFMERRLVAAGGAINRDQVECLDWLIEQCNKLNIERIVLPFVDASRIEGSEETGAVVEVIGHAATTAQDCGIELHLETDMNPAAFADLLSHLPQECIRVNYDTGNSAGLGYSPTEEFAAYGERIGSVHIKDRILNGGTVLLGLGDTDFDAVFNGLSRVEFEGPFIFQVARGEDGDEVNWMRRNRIWFEQLITSATS